MTTIAFKEGVIAYDSRLSADGMIVNDNYDKHKFINGIHFFLSGSVVDYEAFINAYLNNSECIIDAAAFIVEGEKVFISSVSGNRVWRYELNYPDAIGSGHKFALTAMDMGASAIEAVKMAAKRDCKTGGKIRSFKVK